jgi:hypothetical protein
VHAFDDFVARPLTANLTKLHGRDLAKRNPIIYTVRGVDSVEEWADQVLADKESSAIEAHIGTWLEEVARLVSSGIKPGNGVDLQITDGNGVVQLYAIQSAPNTKNAGGRKSDIDALRRGARVLRNQRQQVELNIAVLFGRAKTGVMRGHSDITVLSSDEFWARISGISDFRARLLRATTIVAWLVSAVQRRRQSGLGARRSSSLVTRKGSSIWRRLRTRRGCSARSKNSAISGFSRASICCRKGTDSAQRGRSGRS